jgi:5'-deoxynucleotidase YfbR-like HD superfamily hydrolase
MILAFAKVNRATLHEDGQTPESDTDHTVMVAVCSCALASKLYPYLDIGKIAQFAIIHDLVEVYAGDTNTFNISTDERKEKEARERDAFKKIQKEFTGIYPWISETIEEYESLQTDEAQFVKMVDKVMTKLTHRINRGAYLIQEKKTKEETLSHYSKQTNALEEKYGKKFPEVIEILRKLTDDIVKEAYYVT